ncbi:MAG: FHA domain-containing protein [Myxococcota bacterium]
MPIDEKTLPVERDRRPQPPRSAILVGCDPQTLGLVFPLDGPTTIGREPGVSLRLAYDGVSRLHAKIDPHASGATITDMGSTNGTAVNGVEGGEHRLSSGDRIQLGAVELEFRLETADGLAATKQRVDARARLMLLSDREREVADLVATGLRSAEISERMHISTRTVNTHLEHIYDRLGIRTRPALAGLVARAGLDE